MVAANEEEPTVDPSEPNTALLRVYAVGLNFRDVLNVLGAYPGDPGPPGLDCSGKIAQQACAAFPAAGEAVFGMVNNGALAAHVVVFSHAFQPKPTSLTFAAAASVPTLATTVHLALVDLACLCRWQRVLIHSAAGGVGLTAVSYAHSLGCVVVGTAGAPRKHRFLRKLGVSQIVSSRDPLAASYAMASADGVEVVLNSLSAAFIPLSLALLSAAAQFCEIGKRAIW